MDGMAKVFMEMICLHFDLVVELYSWTMAEPRGETIEDI